MWDLIKEELGNQKKETRNIELKVNGINIQDPKVVADVFNDYFSSIAHNILSSNLLPRNTEVGAKTLGQFFMKPSDFYDAPIGKVLHFIRSVTNKGLSIGESTIDQGWSQCWGGFGPYTYIVPKQ
jgi:hypothetical protein